MHKKSKKITLTLSDRDYRKLTLLAASQNITRPLAAKRLLHEQIASLSFDKAPAVCQNQLGLFDSLQINIFNETSVASDDNP